VENSAGTQVTVINDKMAGELFGSLDPIGKMIKVRSMPFQVIGVYHDVSSFLNGNDDPKAIVPLEAMRRSLHGDYSDLTLTIKPRAHVTRDDAIDEVTVRLRELRGLKPGVENNFAIVTQDQLFATYKKTTAMFFLVMILLSAIGLIVGGVGVVAIMMISVTERTREIGVRKALGATRWMILWQFLVEAITLTSTGASVGLVMGWVASAVMRATTRIPADIPPWAIPVALVASAITGIAFGMVPALRAARLDPVEALRYE
jgi:putative ABC transport system permease protein